MGMTQNQLNLVRYVAENDFTKAKTAALCCCAEDTISSVDEACALFADRIREAIAGDKGDPGTV